MNVFGNLGTVGLAAVLTCLLIFAVPGGGKLKALGWWTTLFVSMLAADTYAAAGGIFSVVPDFAGSVINFINGFVPGLTMAALATSFTIFILFKKLTTKQLAVSGLVFFYVVSKAGGNWSYLAKAIANARNGAQ